MWSIPGHSSGVTSVAISQDGKFVISGSEDRTVREWDAETGLITGGPFITVPFDHVEGSLRALNTICRMNRNVSPKRSVGLA